MSAADSTAGVLELRVLDVRYCKDLNIPQDLNVKARKKQITTIFEQMELANPQPSKLHFDF